MLIEVPYFKYYSKYMTFYNRNKEKFKKANAELKIFDGVPGSHFNGGRSGIRDGIPSKYNINFTLTSPTFTDTDLNEDIAFNILKEYDNKSNSIIISDERLLVKCKETFKHFKYIYSITGFEIIDKTPNDILKEYKKIEQDYDLIVPRVELLDILGQKINILDLKKYIFLYSFECYGCPLYKKHFKEISLIDIGKQDKKFNPCWIKTPSLLTELGIPKPDYEYTTSANIVPRFLELDCAGYKIGRNGQAFDTIIEDILLILEAKGK